MGSCSNSFSFPYPFIRRVRSRNRFVWFILTSRKRVKDHLFYKEMKGWAFLGTFPSQSYSVVWGIIKFYQCDINVLSLALCGDKSLPPVASFWSNLLLCSLFSTTCWDSGCEDCCSQCFDTFACFVFVFELHQTFFPMKEKEKLRMWDAGLTWPHPHPPNMGSGHRIC